MKKFFTILFLGMTCMVFAQDVEITGVVTGTDGLPIIGANVVEKGVPNGATTNVEGKYSIKVADDAVLVFSCIGCETKEVAVGAYSVVDVTLESELTSMDEVVVIGYGTTTKALVTGANLRVSGDEISSQSTATAMEALQGVLPGVSITRKSGAPGAGTKVTIRGLGTIGNSEPLYIVDGVAVGNINYLNSHDIQSIDVLKDAASAAIYGARAANGVILVTTVKGTGNEVKVSYSGYYGVQNIYKNVPVLNAQEYMYIQDEARRNDGIDPYNWEARLKNNPYLDGKYPGQGDTPGLGTQLGEEIWGKLEKGWEGTNWIDEISTPNAPVQSHSINITGAKEDMNYSFGFSYFDQAGIMGTDIIDAGYKRLTARMNTEFVLFKNSSHDIIKIGQNLTYTNTQSKSVATSNRYSNDLHDAIVQNPLSIPYWDKSPSPYGFAPNLDGIDPNHDNPIAQMYDRNNNRWGKGNTIVGNVYAEIQPIKNLIIRSSFGINSWFGHSRSYDEEFGLGTEFHRVQDGVTQSMNQGANYTWTNTATYKFDLGDHHISALIGHEMLKNELSMTQYTTRKNTTFGLAKYAYLINTNPLVFDDISFKDWTGDDQNRDWAAGGGGLLSYMARLSYNYKGKYIFDATMRADGSSNFADGNRWGYFPSVSAGWILTEENFLKESNIVSFAKIRASWGQNGNQSVDNFIYNSNISNTGGSYYLGSNKTSTNTAGTPSNIPNPDISWETSEQLNFGLDASFFDSRLSLTFDWYKKLTKDWLVVAPIMGTSGAGAPWINGGDIENSGVELVLGWNDQVRDFTYGITVSGAFNKNEVVKLANDEGIIHGETEVVTNGAAYVSRVQVGQPIGYFYGFKTDGLFQNQAEVDAVKDIRDKPESESDSKFYYANARPGDVRFVDTNGDGLINDEDKVNIGDPNPDFELGLQLNFGWKGIFLNTTLSGKFGMQVYQSYRSYADGFEQNYTTAIFGRWHGEGTSNKMPRLSSTAHINATNISDLYVQDADFLRINNLTVGYDFGRLLKNVPWIGGAKVYVSVNNLHTFTGYDGMDPDVAYGGDARAFGWASGIDLGLYPLPRTVLFGIDLTF